MEKISKYLLILALCIICFLLGRRFEAMHAVDKGAAVYTANGLEYINSAKR